MIPKIIHYCWFGRGPMPELVTRCLDSWHQYMPDWQYRLWNEDSFSISDAPLYVRQAYDARKFAFVSDYVRLWALEREGGLYMDVDFLVYRSFEPLMDCPEGAFVGLEGSKHLPPMLGVMASEPHGKWVQTMMKSYTSRSFILSDGSFDLTTNVSFFAALGVHRPEWVHIYPVDYFCPLLTTGEYVRSSNTYCEHKGLHSWGGDAGWKARLLQHIPPRIRTFLIKLKRKILG